MSRVTITDQDYQQLERALALENVALRRENVVLQRYIAELEADRERLTRALAPATSLEEADAA